MSVDYVEDGIWNDPEYLDSLVHYAQKIALTDGAQTLSLKLVTITP